MEESNNRILVFGATGTLGTYLIDELRKRYSAVIAITRNQYNAQKDNTTELYHLLKHARPNIIVNCIGYTDLVNAEQEVNKVHELNIEFVEDLVTCRNEIWLKHDHFIKVVHISSDYSRFPHTGVYAKSKLISEGVPCHNRDLIIRTSFKKRGAWNPLTGYKWVADPVYTNADWVDIIAPKIAYAINQGWVGIKCVGTHRKKLLELALQDNPNIRVISPEQASDLVGYTYPYDVTMPI